MLQRPSDHTAIAQRLAQVDAVSPTSAASKVHPLPNLGDFLKRDPSHDKDEIPRTPTSAVLPLFSDDPGAHSMDISSPTYPRGSLLFSSPTPGGYQRRMTSPLRGTSQLRSSPPEAAHGPDK